ncbi:MAG: hypothetical protein KKF48_02645 [Nanoarchaeota archaeon]|nr:hypothetical protein [Nanoarchaeota archaeon]
MKKICLVCSKEYEVYDKNLLGRSKAKGKKGRNKVRGINTLNCSPKCSWIYAGLNREERNLLKEKHKELIIREKKKCMKPIKIRRQS